MPANASIGQPSGASSATGRWPVAALALLTLWELVYPLNLADHALQPWLAVGSFHRLDSLGNLLIVAPLAMMVAWHVTARGGWRWRAMLAAVLVCGLVSLIGETVQVYLPERRSSLADLLLNVMSAIAFAWLGVWLSPKLSAILHRCRTLLAKFPALSRWAWFSLILLAVRWFPYGIAPQSREVRLALQRTWNTGWPFSRSWHWLRGTGLESPVGEWVGGGITLIVWAVWAWLLGRALRERYRSERRGWIDMVMLLGLAAIVIVEPFRLLIDGATFSLTELTAAAMGVIFGSMAEALFSPKRQG